MLSKKIRTEYMKKFKEPKWETFSKCYEESVKYRLTRRVMEHAHKPLWFWEGWDTSTGSDSSASGRSTPKMRNKVVPLEVRPETLSLKSETRKSPEPKPPFVNGEPEPEAKEFTLLDALPQAEVVIESGSLNDPEAAVVEAVAQNSPAPGSTTDEGPAEKMSSDEEPAKEPKRRHRAPRTEPCRRDGSRDEIRPGPGRKPSRAKNQPPAVTTEKENRRPSARLDWSERHASSARRSTNESHTSDAFIQSRRESDKRTSNLDRRRARSADLEKIRRSELTVVDDRWMTEYMRCFSARLR